MTDLQILQDTLQLYLKQSDPRTGFWFIGDRVNSCLCVEGCLLQVLGYTDKEVVEIWSTAGLDRAFDDQPIIDTLSKHEVYQKLLTILERNTLWSINYSMTLVTETLKKAIDNETISND